MRRFNTASLALFTLGFLPFISNAEGLTASYCSSQNTGADHSEVTNHYQSNGACFTNCKSQYAFAIVQGDGCWCSNYIPAEAASIDDCNTVCPGFGQEFCGSTSSGLFGYIALSLAPSGTAGVFSSSSTTSPFSSSSQYLSTQAVSGLSSFAVSVSDLSSILIPPSSTSIFFPSTTLMSPSGSSERSTPLTTSTILTTPVQSSTASPSPVTVSVFDTSTVTASPSVEISTVSSIQTSIPPPTTLQTSTISGTSYTSFSMTTKEQTTSSSWSPTPYTSFITVTGKVQQITITPTASPLAEHQSSSWTGGKTAGIAVGVAVACVLLGLAFFFCMRRRRRNGQAPPPVYKEENASPQRHPSRTSQMSLMGGTRSPLREKPLPQIQTSGLDGIPFMNGHSPDMSSPSSKRGSYPRLHDQRLDPNVLWANQDNGSRVSVRSLQDDHDYSRRVLRLTNPDDN